jgi:2-oxoglutarate ferredoxin oxidoreductase subunit alpha
LLAAIHLSHGDTKHPILIPGNAGECFSFAQSCFDLAERLQQLVIVLSDLELGMNLYMEEQFKYPQLPMDRGKVWTETDLPKDKTFYRYEDLDGDAITYRTLPGDRNDGAAYFTRGSGHNAKGNYTEDSQEYQQLVDRLSKKWQTAKKYIPRPIIDGDSAKIGIIAYGSTDSPMHEARFLLSKKSIQTDYLRIRALPFTEEIESFLQSHELVYLVEQNRDGQMMSLLKSEFPQWHAKMKSILHYDGSPITADFIFESVFKMSTEQTL